MAKTVKLDDQVHQDLEELRTKRETFSQTVARLAAFYRQVSKLVWALGGDHPIVPGQGV
jgi:predicted CopG family antitoxin